VTAIPTLVPLKRPRGRPRKTLSERDEGNRRRQLIRAAARLFRRRGFDGTSTRDIAAAVGMHAGSPFYHFRSKGELLHAVIEAGMLGAISRQSAALSDAGGDAAARLRCLVRNHFETLHGAGRDFIPVMLYESRSLDARQRAAIDRLQRDYEAPWLPVLEALAAQGRLRADVHLARLLIFGALNWSVKWFDKRKRASLDEMTDAAMALFVGERRR
jgi:AcrR family transcriptional regulator